MTVKDAISKKVKEELEKRGITQYRLAKMAGVPKSTISMILANDGLKSIRLSSLIAICSALEIELKDFFNEKYFALSNITADTLEKSSTEELTL